MCCNTRQDRDLGIHCQYLQGKSSQGSSSDGWTSYNRQLLHMTYQQTWGPFLWYTTLEACTSLSSQSEANFTAEKREQVPPSARCGTKHMGHISSNLRPLWRLMQKSIKATIDESHTISLLVCYLYLHVHVIGCRSPQVITNMQFIKPWIP